MSVCIHLTFQRKFNYRAEKVLQIVYVGNKAIFVDVKYCYILFCRYLILQTLFCIYRYNIEGILFYNLSPLIVISLFFGLPGFSNREDCVEGE